MDTKQPAYRLTPNTPEECYAHSIVDICRLRASIQPDKMAFAFLDDQINVKEEITYRGLDNKAQGIARQLIDRNVNHDTTVLLLFAPGIDYISAFMGCLYAGAIAVPAYPVLNIKDFKRLSAITTDCGASLVLTSKEYVSSIKAWLTQNNLHGVECLSISDIAPVDDASLNVEPNEIAFLQYTSGSTGDPKGVMVTQDNLIHNLAQIYRCFAHDEESVGVIWLPPYHDMGLIGGILQPLFGGFPVYLMSPFTFLKQPKRWLEAISKFKATTSGGPNFAYELLIKHADRIKEPLNLGQWKVAFTGAEPIRKATIDRFDSIFSSHGFNGSAFYPCYGLAESTLIASGGNSDEPIVCRDTDQTALSENRLCPPDDSTSCTTLVSSGRSIDNDVVIVDPETCQKLENGRVGEIWLRGKSIAKGYWRKEELSHATFQARTSCGDGPYLRTGDLGVLEQGELFVTGRIKELIIVNGQNHYPTDIEFTVQENHGEVVKKGCGTAFSHVIEDKESLIIVQEVRKEVTGSVDYAQLESSIKSSIFDLHALKPHQVILLPPGVIPKTSSGKIKRVEVKKMYLEGNLRDIRAA